MASIDTKLDEYGWLDPWTKVNNNNNYNTRVVPLSVGEYTFWKKKQALCITSTDLETTTTIPTSAPPLLHLLAIDRPPSWQNVSPNHISETHRRAVLQKVRVSMWHPLFCALYGCHTWFVSMTKPVRETISGWQILHCTCWSCTRISPCFDLSVELHQVGQEASNIKPSVFQPFTSYWRCHISHLAEWWRAGVTHTINEPQKSEVTVDTSIKKTSTTLSAVQALVQINACPPNVTSLLLILSYPTLLSGIAK